MKFKVAEKRCTGCQLCEVACCFQKCGRLGTKGARIRVLFSSHPGRQKIVVCRQCDVCKCVEACKYGAFRRHPQTGAACIHEMECQACLACIDACPFGAVAIDEGKGLPIVCDLCGGHPTCIGVCYRGAISLSQSP